MRVSLFGIGFKNTNRVHTIHPPIQAGIGTSQNLARGTGWLDHPPCVHTADAHKWKPKDDNPCEQYSFAGICDNVEHISNNPWPEKAKFALRVNRLNHSIGPEVAKTMHVFQYSAPLRFRNCCSWGIPILDQMNITVNLGWRGSRNLFCPQFLRELAGQSIG